MQENTIAIDWPLDNKYLLHGYMRVYEWWF